MIVSQKMENAVQEEGCCAFRRAVQNVAVQIDLPQITLFRFGMGKMHGLRKREHVRLRLLFYEPGLKGPDLAIRQQNDINRCPLHFEKRKYLLCQPAELLIQGLF